MKKLFLAYKLGEFGIYNIVAFSSNADRKSYLRKNKDANPDVLDCKIDNIDDGLFVVYKVSNGTLVDLQCFGSENEKTNFIHSVNKRVFDSRNYDCQQIEMRERKCVC